MKKIIILLLVISADLGCEKKKEVLIEDISFDFPASNLAPNMVVTGDVLGLSWLHVDEGKPSLYYNQLTKGKWKTPNKISEGDDWFVNWADFPANAVNENLLLTSYLEKSADGTFTYDIILNLHNLDGTIIKENFILHTDGVKAEHGFVSMIPNEEDGFYISWLDGRNTGGVSHVGAHEGHQGAMTLRTAEITSTGEIVNETELDYKTCDCCQTTMTSTSEGPMVVYRDRSEREIRDIYFTQKIEGEWSEPKAVFNDGWKINGCPVNGPKVVANDTHIAVAWFTAAEDYPLVKVAFSKNGVVEFSNPLELNDLVGLGRVDVAFIDDSSVLVSYMESDENDTYLKVKEVRINGRKSEAITVAKLSASRGTGVPQLEIMDGVAYLMWTEQVDEIKQLRGAKFSLENL